MHRLLPILLLLFAAADMAAPAAADWTIRPHSPCTGLTAGWKEPLPALQKLLGRRWRPMPGPVPGQGLALVFITACPDSTLAGKATGKFTAAFLLVPVEPLILDASAPLPPDTHWIAVVAAAGAPASPVMKLFREQGIPVTAARVSLEVRSAAREHRAIAVIHTTRGTLELSADMDKTGQPFKSALTTAVRVTPPAILFSGPEDSTRYGKGQIRLQAKGATWLREFHLQGTPALVTLDRNFSWQFAFPSQ